MIDWGYWILWIINMAVRITLYVIVPFLLFRWGWNKLKSDPNTPQGMSQKIGNSTNIEGFIREME